MLTATDQCAAQTSNQFFCAPAFSRSVWWWCFGGGWLCFRRVLVVVMCYDVVKLVARWHEVVCLMVMSRKGNVVGCEARWDDMMWCGVIGPTSPNTAPVPRKVTLQLHQIHCACHKSDALPFCCSSFLLLFLSPTPPFCYSSFLLLFLSVTIPSSDPDSSFLFLSVTLPFSLILLIVYSP